jgi:predicted transcriptional regulator
MIDRLTERRADQYRFERAWDLARKGKARGTEVRLSFESLSLLLSNLTPARWVLLEQLKREGPLSINS